MPNLIFACLRGPVATAASAAIATAPAPAPHSTWPFTLRRTAPPTLTARSLCWLALSALALAPAFAQPTLDTIPADPKDASRLDSIEVTSTHFGLSAQEAPDSMAVISGEDLRARGASDLRSALALLAGVSVYPGGDAGSAGANPSLLGRIEADDFLLLVDGVPAGGAFIPAFATLDMHDVERIEVIRGNAPVFFGTTAFAGTIHVIHYPAGRSDRTLSIGTGSFGSAAASVSTALSEAGPLRQSVLVDAARNRVAGNDVGADRVHALYRVSSDTALGRVHADLDVVRQWQLPPSPVPVDANGYPTSTLPADFSQLPADGHLNDESLRLSSGVDGNLARGRWGATLSWTQTWRQALEGFFDGFPTASGAGFQQTRHIQEVFLDAHATQTWVPGVDTTVGVNELFGRAQQHSETFAYTLPATGVIDRGTGQAISDGVGFGSTRSLFGSYLQARWKATPSITVLGGLRENVISHVQAADDWTGGVHASEHTNRLSGSLGASWRVWYDEEADLDDVMLHVAASDTLQLPQVDFSPAGTMAAAQGLQPLFAPETQRNITVGTKMDGLDGRFDADVDFFYTLFDHQPLAGVQGYTVAGGATRFRGAEVEGSFRVSSALRVTAGYSWDAANFRDYNDAALGQLEGNRLPLVARERAFAAITLAPASGFQFAGNWNLEGQRYLDYGNQLPLGAYATLDVMLGWRWQALQWRVKGSNLSNRREPVTASDLADGQYYLTPTRHWMTTIEYSF